MAGFIVRLGLVGCMAGYFVAFAFTVTTAVGLINHHDPRILWLMLPATVFAVVGRTWLYLLAGR